MIAFIDDHRGQCGVEPICRALPIAPSIYHACAARRHVEGVGAHPPGHVLRGHAQQAWEKNYRAYEVRKVWRQLGREGIGAARCTAARLMRQMGLNGIVRGRSARTTTGDEAAPFPPDRANREFRA